MNTFLIILDSLVVIGAIFLGVRTGGVGLGIFGAAGVFVLVVTMAAFLVSYTFVVGSGISNIFYPLILVIYEVSYAKDICLERPLPLSTVTTASCHLDSGSCTHGRHACSR